MNQGTRELLTLQIGPYANYVGTHFWNAQDIDAPDGTTGILNHNVLFQAGETQKGEGTLTPRLIVVDAKENLGYLSSAATLYHDQEQDEITPAWSGNVNAIRQPRAPKHAYIHDLDVDEQQDTLPTVAQQTAVYNFEQTVHAWPDYLRLYLHPKSLGGGVLPRNTRLDWFHQASDVWQQTDALDTLLDDELRWFAEGCDHLQGFQVMTDVLNGYGGYASKLLSELRDEYGKTPMLVFGVSSPKEAEQTDMARHRRAVNAGSSVAALSSLATTYVPLCIPTDSRRPSYMLPPHPSHYATSALLAMGIDAVTMNLRTTNLSDIAALINQREINNIASLDIALPFLASGQHQSWEAVAETLARPGTFTPLLPKYVPSVRSVSYAHASVFCSGQPSVLPMSTSARGDVSGNIDALNGLIRHSLVRASQCLDVNVACLPELYRFPVTFPNLLARHQTLCKSLKNADPPDARQDALVARLHASTEVADTLEDLCARLRSTASRSTAAAFGVDRDDYDETLQAVVGAWEAYRSDTADGMEA
ncbi:tubulin domain-containing protein [Thamnocephalis sphaerospora]|uniref:Tubulin domain-containing protein n=1 Tax=Thamnocephalis sphaerospora TaxID=78915 RepID=A0A4P9XWM4_9FUNG|nr:tubulin domain-containing protein [Thamnocephalis sphaerospora]|eukprot:RKP10031.1 tubulin domain-containing protein [Thamnocephalis sphaerospora]